MNDDIWYSNGITWTGKREKESGLTGLDMQIYALLCHCFSIGFGPLKVLKNGEFT